MVRYFIIKNGVIDSALTRLIHAVDFFSHETFYLNINLFLSFSIDYKIYFYFRECDIFFHYFIARVTRYTWHFLPVNKRHQLWWQKTTKATEVEICNNQTIEYLNRILPMNNVTVHAHLRWETTSFPLRELNNTLIIVK